MVKVKCPICGTPVEGEDSEELTAGLREHMIGTHDLNELSSCPPPGEIDTSKKMEANTMGHRLQQAEMRREEETWAPPEGSEVPKRPEGLGDWVRKSLGRDDEVDPESRSKEEWRNGQGYPTMMRENMHSIRREDEKEAHKEDLNVPHELGNRPHQEVTGRYTIVCPMGDAKVSGNSDEELSDALKKHMVAAHQIKEVNTI